MPQFSALRRLYSDLFFLPWQKMQQKNKSFRNENRETLSTPSSKGKIRTSWFRKNQNAMHAKRKKKSILVLNKKTKTKPTNQEKMLSQTEKQHN